MAGAPVLGHRAGSAGLDLLLTTGLRRHGPPTVPSPRCRALRRPLPTFTVHAVRRWSPRAWPTYPLEACGLLGSATAGRPAGRARPRPATRPSTQRASSRVYTVEPRDMLRADRAGRGRRPGPCSGCGTPTPTPTPTLAHRRGPGAGPRLVVRPRVPARRRAGGAQPTGSAGGSVEERPHRPTMTTRTGRLSLTAADRRPPPPQGAPTCPLPSACPPSSARLDGRFEATVQRRGGDGRARSSTTCIRQHPGLKDQLLTPTASLHRHLNVFLNDDDIRYLGKLDAKVARPTPSP